MQTASGIIATMIHAQADHSKRYRGFFRGVQYVTIGFGVVELVSAWWFGSLTLAATGIVSAMVGMFFAVATQLLQQKRLEAGLSVAIVGTSVGAMVYMLVMPEIMTSLVLFPIAIIGIAMLGQSRRLLIGAVFLATLTNQIILALAARPAIFPPPPLFLTTIFFFATPTVITLMLGLLFGYTWSSLGTALQTSQQQNKELTSLRDHLAEQVAARTSELEQALTRMRTQANEQARLLDETTRQRQQIRALSVPILPVSTQALVLPLVGTLDAERLETLRQRTLTAVEQRRARYVLLDLTGVEFLDQQGANELIGITRATRLLGARPILIGIRPEVAETLVTLQVDPGDLTSMRDLATALTWIQGQ